MAEVSFTSSPTRISFYRISEIISSGAFFAPRYEYFSTARPLLRDILNLFLDSGLGNTPYALIEQGALASVIDSKPSERKLMIDEAAGIMKYKLRKKAATAKLEAAEQNLLRLGDIISEVEQQRNSLSRQAKKAKEYEDLRRRIEYLEGYLRIRDYHEAQEEAQKIDLTLREKSEERTASVRSSNPSTRSKGTTSIGEPGWHPATSRNPGIGSRER
jgi:chromosome segregation protein